MDNRGKAKAARKEQAAIRSKLRSAANQKRNELR